MKKPVPKKKASYGRTTRRFKAHAREMRTQLKDYIQLVECPDCKSQKINHSACPVCGKYNGRQVIDMTKKMEKITKVKA